MLLAEHDGLAGAIVDQSLGDGDSTAFCGPASKTGHPIKLSLVESLLLALGDLKVLSAQNIHDVLEGIAETHHDAAELTTGAKAALHLKVAGHAKRIMLGGNSGR